MDKGPPPVQGIVCVTTTKYCYYNPCFVVHQIKTTLSSPLYPASIPRAGCILGTTETCNS